MAEADSFRFTSTGARMKVGQKSIIRWVGKLFAKEPQRSSHDTKSDLRTLDESQLRQVAGGSGNSTATPTKTW
jgi:hypothetical protein